MSAYSRVGTCSLFGLSGWVLIRGRPAVNRIHKVPVFASSSDLFFALFPSVIVC